MSAGSSRDLDPRQPLDHALNSMLANLDIEETHVTSHGAVESAVSKNGQAKEKDRVETVWEREQRLAAAREREERYLNREM